MRVIVPLKLKDEDIVSYSVKPDPYSVWQNSVAYRRGRRVIVYDGVNKIYESLYPNVDRYPPDNTQQEQPAWLLVGPVNLWSMLNPVPDQRTRGMNEIYVEVSPASPVTAVGAHGLEGTSIRVQVFSATGTTLTDRTTALTYESTIGSGLYSEAVFSQLPWASGARIRVTVSNPGKLAICESLVFGEYKTIGATQPLAAVNVIDPSEKVFDTFGRAYAKRRDQKKGVTATVVVPRDSIDYCQSILANLRATPTTWVTEETIPLSIVYGMYRDFEISLDSPRHGTCRLEVGPIIYEPIVPPVKPLGDSVFWTSRPYPVISGPDSITSIPGSPFIVDVALEEPSTEVYREALAGESLAASALVTSLVLERFTVDFGDEEAVTGFAITGVDLRDPYRLVEPPVEALQPVAGLFDIVLRLMAVTTSPPSESLRPVAVNLSSIQLDLVVKISDNHSDSVTGAASVTAITLT